MSALWTAPNGVAQRPLFAIRRGRLLGAASECALEPVPREVGGVERLLV
jgi:hypothetical protein